MTADKVLLVKRKSQENQKDYYGLLIQIHDSLYFYKHDDRTDKRTFTDLVNELDMSVKLEVLRGLNDEFYYALKDKGNVGDSLRCIKVNLIDNELKLTDENIPAPYTGQILALELDPFHTNDIEAHVDQSEVEEGRPIR